MIFNKTKITFTSLLIIVNLIVFNNAAISDSDLYAANMNGLVKHNYYRENHEVPELELDQSLVLIAQQHAENQARNDTFEHSTHFKTGLYGENLYFDCTSSVRDITEVATIQWYKEINLYNYNDPEPEPSIATAHFTQLIWKSTRQVGFGIASNTKKIDGEKINCTIVVAIYTPPGNLDIKLFEENVLVPREDL